MKRLFLVAALMFATAAHAVNSNDVDGVGFNKLSEADKLEIMKTIAAKAGTVDPTVSTAQNVSAWAQTMSEVGKGLAGTAKELGIVANDFVKSPVGQWTAFLIIWHYMGDMAVHVAGGLIILFLGVVGIWWYARMNHVVHIKYSADKKDMFGRACLVSVDKEPLNNTDSSVVVFSSFVLLVAWAFITFSF